MKTIVITAGTDGQQKVLIDGHDITPSVVAIGFNTAPGEPTEVTLVVVPKSLVVAATVDKISVVEERI